jgi:hypothetical protein
VALAVGSAVGSVVALAVGSAVGSAVALVVVGEDGELTGTPGDRFWNFLRR